MRHVRPRARRIDTPSRIPQGVPANALAGAAGPLPSRWRVTWSKTCTAISPGLATSCTDGAGCTAARAARRRAIRTGRATMPVRGRMRPSSCSTSIARRPSAGSQASTPARRRGGACADGCSAVSATGAQAESEAAGRSPEGVTVGAQRRRSERLSARPWPAVVGWPALAVAFAPGRRSPSSACGHPGNEARTTRWPWSGAPPQAPGRAGAMPAGGGGFSRKVPSNTFQFVSIRDSGVRSEAGVTRSGMACRPRFCAAEGIGEACDGRFECFESLVAGLGAAGLAGCGA